MTGKYFFFFAFFSTLVIIIKKLLHDINELLQIVLRAKNANHKVAPFTSQP